MNVGVLGSGDVAQALGRGFAACGHDVMLGTREPRTDTLDAWKKEAGAHARVGTMAEAANFGEVVVLAVRGSVAHDAIELAGGPGFDGKVVIDVMNPLDFSSGGPALFVGHTDSLGEQVQRQLPKARVVKAFNTVGNVSFFRPNFPAGRLDMWICGNDAAAKKTVTSILDEFGWGAIDVGRIEASRVLEPLCILWVYAAMALQSYKIAIHVQKR
jgi:8-hydroxy-5-deazaflavin:NADPH oxidoreductase